MKKIKVVTAAAALRAVVVNGTHSPVDPANGVYEMSGDLIGDWYTTSFHELGFTPSGALRGAGTELFVGCFDADGSGACDGEDPGGTMNFKFTYTGRSTRPPVLCCTGAVTTR